MTLAGWFGGADDAEDDDAPPEKKQETRSIKQGAKGTRRMGII